MIIDFHTHTFKDSIAQKALESLSNSSSINPFTDGTYKGLIKSMDDAKIDYSVSFLTVFSALI